MSGLSQPPPPSGHRFLDALHRFLFRFYGPAEVDESTPASPRVTPPGGGELQGEWTVVDGDGQRYLRRTRREDLG